MIVIQNFKNCWQGQGTKRTLTKKGEHRSWFMPLILSLRNLLFKSGIESSVLSFFRNERVIIMPHLSAEEQLDCCVMLCIILAKMQRTSSIARWTKRMFWRLEELDTPFLWKACIYMSKAEWWSNTCLCVRLQSLNSCLVCDQTFLVVIKHWILFRCRLQSLTKTSFDLYSCIPKHVHVSIYNYYKLLLQNVHISTNQVRWMELQGTLEFASSYINLGHSFTSCHSRSQLSAAVHSECSYGRRGTDRPRGPRGQQLCCQWVCATTL